MKKKRLDESHLPLSSGMLVSDSRIHHHHHHTAAEKEKEGGDVEQEQEQENVIGVDENTPLDKNEIRGELISNEPLRLRLIDLILLNAFAFGFSFTASTLYLIIIPDEATALFPDGPAQGLAILLAIAGSTQLMTPIGGYLSDNTHSTRWGRRIPWIVFGSIGMVLSLVFLGIVRYSSRKTLLFGIEFIYILLFIAFNITANVAYAAFTGIIPDLVPAGQVGEASGVLAVSGSLGGLSGVLVVSLAISEPRSSYFVFAVCNTIGALITCYGIMRLWKIEHKMVGHRDDPPSSSLSVRHVFQRCSTDFTWVWLSRLLFYMSMSTQAWLLFFIRDLIIPNDATISQTPEQLTAIVLVVGMISSSIVAGPFGMLSDRIGRKKLVYLASTLMALVDMWWALSYSMWQVTIGAVFYGLATGCFLSVDLALAIETIDREFAAQALGVWGVAAFIGSTLGPALSGPLLTFWGNEHWNNLSMDDNGQAYLNLSSSSPPSPVLENRNHHHSNMENIRYSRLGYASVLGLAAAATLLSGLCIKFVVSVR